MRRHAAWLAALAVLTVTGFVLRETPQRLAPAGPAGGDRAYHLRMVETLAREGRLPGRDPLSEPPEGRATARLLPVGMYQAAAAMHRALGGVPRDLERHAGWFVALAGALIVWPVWLLARSLGLTPAAALAAALLAAVLPAHVHRTYAGWLRYDGAGTLLATLHLALLAAALASSTARARRLLATGAALAMIAALATWRVALAVPAFEAAWAALAFAARGGRGATRETLTITLLVTWAGMPAIEYVRAQGLWLAPAWLAALFAALAAWAPARTAVAPSAPARGGHAAWLAPGWLRRLGAIGAAALAGGLIGRLVHSAAADPAAVPVTGLLAARVRTWLAPAAPVDPMAALLLGVEELQPVSLAEFAGPGYLSWCAPLLLASALWFGWRAWRLRGAVPARAALAGTLCAALVAGVFLWARTKVLLAPLAAVAIAALFDAPGGGPGVRAPRAPRGGATASGRGSHPGARAAVGLALAAAAALAASASWGIVTSRTSPIEPDLAAAYAFLSRRAAPDEVLLGPWERGYELQSHTGRAAVMDGLLESGENRRRIAAFARAALAPAADSLAAFCDRYDATYLLVPPSTQLYGIALLARAPFVHKLIPGIPLTPAEADRTLIRMMVFGRDEPGFRKVFEQGAYRVYRRDRAAPDVP